MPTEGSHWRASTNWNAALAGSKRAHAVAAKPRARRDAASPAQRCSRTASRGVASRRSPTRPGVRIVAESRESVGTFTP